MTATAREPLLALMEPPQPLSPLRPGSIHRDAKFSADGRCRWTLVRRWRPEGPLLLYCGLNPSTASHLQDDPTSQAWTHFGRLWEFSGYIAVNMLPKCSPSPTQARDWYERGINRIERDRILTENGNYIRDAAKQCTKAVACWGSAAWLPPDLVERLCATLKAAGHTELYCVGTNADGAPIHFMARGKNRIRRDAELTLWRTLT